jgi:hypothetical protein
LPGSPTWSSLGRLDDATMERLDVALRAVLGL